MHPHMSGWQTALISLCGLLIGAGLAIVGSVQKEPTLTNLGSTIIGGALGIFVPQRQQGTKAPAAQPRRLTAPQLPPMLPPKG